MVEVYDRVNSCFLDIPPKNVAQLDQIVRRELVIQAFPTLFLVPLVGNAREPRIPEASAVQSARELAASIPSDWTSMTLMELEPTVRGHGFGFVYRAKADGPPGWNMLPGQHGRGSNGRTVRVLAVREKLKEVELRLHRGVGVPRAIDRLIANAPASAPVSDDTTKDVIAGGTIEYCIGQLAAAMKAANRTTLVSKSHGIIFRAEPSTEADVAEALGKEKEILARITADAIAAELRNCGKTGDVHTNPPTKSSLILKLAKEPVAVGSTLWARLSERFSRELKVAIGPLFGEGYTRGPKNRKQAAVPGHPTRSWVIQLIPPATPLNRAHRRQLRRLGT